MVAPCLAVGVTREATWYTSEATNSQEFDEIAAIVTQEAESESEHQDKRLSMPLTCGFMAWEIIGKARGIS